MIWRHTAYPSQYASYRQNITLAVIRRRTLIVTGLVRSYLLLLHREKWLSVHYMEENKSKLNLEHCTVIFLLVMV
jgi:hypothetical protein